MKRRIITIDREKCNGCGLCAKACHEGAIGMVAGKAELLREDYCDGLGDCLPACPTGAISFEEREAPAYNAEAVRAAQAEKARSCDCSSHSCPGCPSEAEISMPGQLRNFPVQLKLAPTNAPWLSGADLLIAADCTAYACGDFHRRFLKGRVAVIGCPKLDGVDYTEKLTQIIAANDIRSITVVRMTVPCCGGLVFWVKNALAACGKEIPLQIVTVSPDGRVIGS